MLEEAQEQEQIIANDGAMADVANNQAHLFHRYKSSHPLMHCGKRIPNLGPGSLKEPF